MAAASRNFDVLGEVLGGLMNQPAFTANYNGLGYTTNSPHSGD